MIKYFISKQFLQYITIGFLGTGLDFLILYSLVKYLHIFYLLASLISIGIVFWISFTLNKYWTFNNREKKYFEQSLRYLMASAVGIGINLIVLTLLVEIFGLWYIFAKVFATGAALIWNFLVTKKWVFKTEKKKLKTLKFNDNI